MKDIWKIKNNSFFNKMKQKIDKRKKKCFKILTNIMNNK